MWRRSTKYTAKSRNRNDDPGCMQGLFNMFYVRPVSNTPRLLADRTHRGSGRPLGYWYSRNKLKLLTNVEEKHEDLDHADRHEAGKPGSDTTNAKTLTDEEMSKGQSLSDSGSSSNQKQRNKASGVVSIQNTNNLGVSSSLESDQLNLLKPEEISSSNINLVALLEEFSKNRPKDQQLHMGSMSSIFPCPSEEGLPTGIQNSLDQPDVQVQQEGLVDQKSLEKAIEDFLLAKFSDVKQTTGDESLHQSEEFLKTSEILRSNKEFFVKVLQYPNSVLLKHFHNLQKADIENPCTSESLEFVEEIELSENVTCSLKRCEEPVSHKLFQKQNNKTFSEEDKLQGTTPSKENSQPLSRIVVLKPRPVRNQSSPYLNDPNSSSKSPRNLKPHRETERVASHFSMREIKRRFKHAIGIRQKDQKLISKDEVVQKLSYVSQASGDIGDRTDTAVKEADLTSSCSTEQASKPSSSANGEEKKAMQKDSQSAVEFQVASHVDDNSKYVNTKIVPHTQLGESNFQRKAKHHLVEMLDFGNDDGHSKKHVSKTLEELLYMLSPRMSPGREKEPVLSPRQMRFSPMQSPEGDNSEQPGPSELNLENLHSTTSESNSQPKVLGSDPELLFMHVQEDCSYREASHPENFEKTIDQVGTGLNKLTNDASVLSEIGSKGADDVEHNGYSPFSTLSTEVPECVEKADQASPVSVLEPLVLDNTISPGSTKKEFVMPPRKIHFEDHDDSGVGITISNRDINQQNCVGDDEFKFEYMRALLEASGLCSWDTSRRWHPSRQLLDPSLYDEVETPTGEIPDDLKLLFDCINEVLEEIYERSSSYMPWVSKPNLQPFSSGEKLIQGVWRGLNSSFVPQLATTLDNIIKKDLETRTWMDIRYGAEDIGIAVGDEILDEILEETLLELCDLNLAFS